MRCAGRRHLAMETKFIYSQISLSVHTYTIPWSFPIALQLLFFRFFLPTQCIYITKFPEGSGFLSSATALRCRVRGVLSFHVFFFLSLVDLVALPPLFAPMLLYHFALYVVSIFCCMFCVNSVLC